MAKKKSKRKSPKRGKKNGCQRVVICGNARKICWKNGRISSNKPWKRKAG